MTSIEHLAGLVCNLTELELQSFLENIRDHISKNGLTQVVNNTLGDLKSDQLYELEEHIDRYKDEISDIEIERDRYEDIIDEAKKAMPIRFEDFTQEHFNELESILK